MRFTIYSILLITAVVALLLAIKMHGIALIAIFVFLLELIATCIFVRGFLMVRYRFANSLAPILYPRDGKKAMENATNMCIRSDWKDWAAVSVLGAAFAENGDFGEAVKYA